MYRSMKRIAHPKEKIYFELTKRGCEHIKDRNFEPVVSKLAKNRKERLLYEKYMHKLFFIDLRLRRSSREIDTDDFF